ncbi:ATP-binding protein [Reichenbachiella ulvae]|uniref:histidine kinase n=1 Tax=Reichenbachiella ulvae TaxID=2980104 RepID=A0ABT3CT12_9BACT|nr:tetratricopeptide repeat-containing sensor histidine kinase [Reichenbachiella ulvae]MCV9386817.1 tetratricopeptide repeat-containing sensor histidine kinase [Reichenbachiella ulvae]
MLKAIFKIWVFLWFIPQAWAIDSNDLVNKGDSCFVQVDYDCALESYQAALSFEDGDSSVILYVQIRNKIADVYYQSGEFREAYADYKEGLSLADRYTLLPEKAKALEGLAHILWRYGDNVKSISSILEAIQIFKELKDTSSLVSSSNILAGIYMSTGEIDKAGEIYSETLSLAIAGKDSLGMASSYEYKGVTNFFKEDFKKAIQFYEKSLLINKQLGNSLEAGINNANIGEAYNSLGDFQLALEYFEEAENLMKKHDFKSGLIFVNYSTGVSHCGLKNFSEAFKRYQRSLELIEITGEEREKPQVLKLLSDCYAQSGDYKNAFNTHLQYVFTKDSLEHINRNIELMDIMARYEVDKKEQENLLLSKENENKAQELENKETIIFQQKVFGIVLFGFLLLSFYLYYKLSQNRTQLLLANQTKDKLFGFVAHDLKAPMANIQMLIDLLKSDVSDENVEVVQTVAELNNASHSVSLLLNDLLSWSISQQRGFVFAPKPIDLKLTIDGCIELFQEQLEYKELEVVNEVQEEPKVWVDEKAIQAIIRNLISNAIKFSHRNGIIQFKSASEGKELTFTIIDAGVGMSQEQVDGIMNSNAFVTNRGTANEKGSGMGMNLIKDFVVKSKGKLLIHSQENKGTQVYITLPLA